MTDSEPPYSLESERAILSLSMIDPTALKRLSPILTSADFYNRSHAEIYAACLSVYSCGETVDAVRVATKLKDDGKLASIGGMAYLTDCLNAAPNTANLLAYAKTVKDTARLRGLIRTCQTVITESQQPHGDHLAFIAKSRASLMDVTRIAQYDAMAANSDALRDLFRRMQHGLKGEVLGLKTGLDALDRLTLGLHGGQLTIIGARPGQGKSSLLLQMATEVAKTDIGVLAFSLEMTQSELVERQLAFFSRIDATLLRMGKLTASQWQIVTSAADQLSKLPLWINDKSDLTIHNIRELTLGAVDKAYLEKKPLGLIVVDYLQRVHMPAEKFRQRREQVDEVARLLKQLAKETGLPVVAAAQVKRIAEGRPSKTPTLDDLREAGNIENEADVVILIHHPGQYDKNVDKSEASLLIEKSRHGRTGRIKVVWRPEFTCFDNAPEDPADW